MAKITRKVLTVLETIYRFSSGQRGAPQEVELGLGITPVHDLSRMSELGAANGRRSGLWIASAFQVHTVTGALADTLDLINPAVASEGYSMDEEKEWAWILNAWGDTSDGSDLANAEIVVEPITGDRFIGPSDAVPDSSSALIAAWNSSGSMALSGNRVLLGKESGVQLPFLVFSPQDGILFRSLADNLGTTQVNLNVLLWIGPLGVLPPGLA